MAADRLLIFAPDSNRLARGPAPPLSETQANALRLACIRDMVTLAARERGRVELWTAGRGRDARELAREFAHLPNETQATGALGDRIADAFDRSFADGAERVVILTVPTPTLRESTLTIAFKDLQDADVVLGPARRGGAYLIGVRLQAWPRARSLFAGVTDAALHEGDAIVARSADSGLELRVLPGWYGIESAEDLERARADASPDSHLARWLEEQNG
jgi:glycosyltransferase A (GT-A) superfamily protein (DUF2064 family)